jgi:hypothetical protein
MLCDGATVLVAQGIAGPAAKVKVSGLGGSLSLASWRKRGVALDSGFAFRLRIRHHCVQCQVATTNNIQTASPYDYLHRETSSLLLSILRPANTDHCGVSRAIPPSEGPRTDTDPTVCPEGESLYRRIPQRSRDLEVRQRGRW